MRPTWEDWERAQILFTVQQGKLRWIRTCFVCFLNCMVAEGAYGHIPIAPSTNHFVQKKRQDHGCGSCQNQFLLFRLVVRPGQRLRKERIMHCPSEDCTERRFAGDLSATLSCMLLCRIYRPHLPKNNR